MTETIRKQFERHLRQGRFFAKDDLVVAAVSTGVDSMALLDLLQLLPDDLRPRILVAHVNHELREQSLAEEDYLREYCHQRDLELAVAHWSKEAHPQHGIEEAARKFRYAFFKQLLKEHQATAVVTAHHANDLAETMLMKLTRGGQLDQLLGIRDERPLGSGRLVRPLLPFTKDELYRYAEKRQLTWFEDQTNQELTVARNRFRHRIIPAMEEENDQLVSHLLSYRDQLADLLSWRDRELSKKMEDMLVDGRLQLSSLSDLPKAQQKDLLYYWLVRSGVVDLKRRLVDQLQRGLSNRSKPQERFKLPGEWLLVRSYDECWLTNINKKLSLERQKIGAHMVKLGQQYPINAHEQVLVTADPSRFTTQDSVNEIWLAPAQLPLTLRPWQPGDRLCLKGGGHQLVRRVLIDQKVTAESRLHQLVLVDARGDVVWLLDRKWSWFDRPANYRQCWQRLFIGIKKQRGENL